MTLNLRFYSEMDAPEKTLNILLKPRALPGHIQGVYVQNILKLFIRIVTGLMELNNCDEIVTLCNMLQKKLPVFVSSGHIEVQERASSALVLIQMLREKFPPTEIHVNDVNSLLVETEKPEEPTDGFSQNVSIPIEAIEIVQEMAMLFAGDLNPVAPKAQKKVPVPEGLNLDDWINQASSDSSESSEGEQREFFIADNKNEQDRKTKPDLTPEVAEKVCRLVTLMLI